MPERADDAGAKFLRIYLRDHLAMATTALELCERTLRENRGTDFERALSSMRQELAEDKSTLRHIAEVVGYRPPRSAEAGAWVVEKLGRFKRNGQWVGYSPLSRLEELEALLALASQRKVMWRALSLVAARDERLRRLRLEERAEVARCHEELLEGEVLAAAARALPGVGAP